MATSEEEVARLRAELAHKNELIEAYQGGYTALNRHYTCAVCDNLMFEPCVISCGHSFCYSCLLEWFKRRKSCPTCRTKVELKPTISIQIKESVFLLTEKRELFDPTEDKEEVIKRRKEENDLVAAHKRDHGDIFPDMFTTPVTDFLVDNEDGVRRCIRCHWELLGDYCRQCGNWMSGDYAGSDFDSEEDDESSLGDEAEARHHRRAVFDMLARAVTADDAITIDSDDDDPSWFSEEDDGGEVDRMTGRAHVDITPEHFLAMQDGQRVQFLDLDDDDSQDGFSDEEDARPYGAGVYGRRIDIGRRRLLGDDPSEDEEDEEEDEEDLAFIDDRDPEQLSEDDDSNQATFFDDEPSDHGGSPSSVSSEVEEVAAGGSSAAELERNRAVLPRRRPVVKQSAGPAKRTELVDIFSDDSEGEEDGDGEETNNDHNIEVQKDGADKVDVSGSSDDSADEDQDEQEKDEDEARFSFQEIPAESSSAAPNRKRPREADDGDAHQSRSARRAQRRRRLEQHRARRANRNNRANR
ncbi:hypothetical protein BZA70DRAFT_273212 [Myxozyma melibiosi]|uniref:RING-type domain-containing protein n=1 Tax=Myxozyma melibiosi TaxID=54550 RepID=A0ABR1FEG7_9ASCO